MYSNLMPPIPIAKYFPAYSAEIFLNVYESGPKYALTKFRNSY